MIWLFQQIWFILFGAISFILSQLDESSNIVILKTLCHRKRWPRSSFLSQERPWPQTFCKIRPILAKNLYFSAYFPLFLLFSWRRILANRFNFLDFFGYEWKKKEGFGREISLPKVASSSLKMQRKCRKEKDKKFCLDETKRKMARYSYSRKTSFSGIAKSKKKQNGRYYRCEVWFLL